MKPTIPTLPVTWDPESTTPKRNGYRGASMLDGLILGYIEHAPDNPHRWFSVVKSNKRVCFLTTSALAMADCERRMNRHAREYLADKARADSITTSLNASYARDATALAATSTPSSKEHPMSNPRAAGIKVELLRRFGGHGGRPTEWEISTDNDEAKAMIRSLPRIALIDHSTGERASSHGHWIILPEGTSVGLAGEVTACLASLDEDALIAALYRASIEGAAHADWSRLVDRAKAWMAKQDTFTALQLSEVLKVPRWRAVDITCHVAACGLLIPVDECLDWSMTDSAKRVEALTVEHTAKSKTQRQTTIADCHDVTC